MSLGLTLCPDTPSRSRLGGWFLAYQRLRLDSDYAVFAQIADIGRGFGPPVVVPLELGVDCEGAAEGR